MKLRLLTLISAVIFVSALAIQSFAQTAMVQGTCQDSEGKPIVGAVVEYKNLDTGQTYHIKTDKKGHFLSLGVVAGPYDVILMENGKQIYSLNHVHVDLDETKNTLDINLKREQELAAKGVGVSREQLQKMQEAKAKEEAQHNLIKSLNDKLAAAKQAELTGDFDGAIKILTDAAQMDPTEGVIWGRLAELYSESAPKQTDPAAKNDRYTQAVASFQKAIDARQKTIGTKTPSAADQDDLGAYYNNMGEAYSKLGNTDQAVKAYNQAATINPSKAGQYYFNEGAILTNANKSDEAIAAFDKCIAADPSRADAYYYKGIDLLGKATLKGSKMVAPDGTAEAFNKYLELKPDGPNAETAKEMLAQIGAPVQTNYGKKGKTSKR